MNTLNINTFVLNKDGEVCLVVDSETVLNIVEDYRESIEGCVSISEEKANDILRQNEDFIQSSVCSRFVTHYERCSNVPYYTKATFKHDEPHQTLFCEDCGERFVNVEQLKVKENVYKFTNNDEYVTLVNFFMEGYSKLHPYTEAGLIVTAQVEYYDGDEDVVVTEFTILTNSELLKQID